MNTFTKLSMHMNKHVYTKGAHKGDAPLDGSRRGRCTHRVVKQSDHMAVIMHRTSILQAYEDGTFMLDTAGWHGSPTTKEAVGAALRFTPLKGRYIYSRRVFGKSQLCISLKDGRVVRYYDGMKFDADGMLTTPLQTFERYGIDKQESKRFADDIKASGFKAMFPLLYTTCKAPDSGIPHLPDHRRLQHILETDYNAHQWSEIIEYFKFEMQYDYKTQTRFCVERGDIKSCWAAIMKACKFRMYELTATTVTSI